MIKNFVRAALLASAASFASPVIADVNPGAYLAGRQAAASSDFVSAARYLTQALASDPKNTGLLENAMSAHVAVGNFDAAASIAETMRDIGSAGQLANLVLYVTAAKEDNWTVIFEELEAGHTVSPLVDNLAQAWAFVGLGEMNKALAAFDEVIDTEGMKAYGTHSKAMALALVGDFEGANELYSTPGLGYTARSVISHAQVLSQLDRNDDALEMLSAIFGDVRDPGLMQLNADLKAGETLPFDVIDNAQNGLGEVALLVAGLIRGDTPDGYTLVYARAAEFLAPNNTTAILLTGGLLENLGQYDLANETYLKVAANDPAYTQAELGRIDVLRRAGHIETAAEAAAALARDQPDIAAVHSKLGDVLYRVDQDANAIEAYTRALELLPEGDETRWVVYYRRAIAEHRRDNWPNAEADFRAALDIRPNQPEVLNYLGYSLVERDEKMEEALGMIEKAVEGAPDNGAIIDSLGWVLFQMGRYEESVTYMERAASLEAVDPIVNDHLGDVFWAVGRFIEAEFQWNRALSFDPEEELADRIRMKLEIGLDAVLEAEGADPLRPTGDSN